jgi:arylsulfatase A
MTEFQRDNVFGPDVFTDFIITFIQNHKDAPFFVYYPMVLPHPPFINTPDNLNNKKVNNQKRYEGMVSYMDKLVGRIVSAVKDSGLLENTVIFFMGDNGTPQEVVSTMDNIVIRGGKGQMTDTGTRVPLIVNWKGIIPERLVVNDLVDLTDIFPTLSDIAQFELKSDLTIDGRSFLPQLKGKAGNPREWVYIQYRKDMAFRTMNWKLNDDGWLFDLKADPFENHRILKDKDTADSARARQRIERIVKNIFNLHSKK